MLFGNCGSCCFHDLSENLRAALRNLSLTLVVGETDHYIDDNLLAAERARLDGAGVKYDLDDTFHLLGYLGPTVQNAQETDRYTWYASILFTF